MEKLRILYVTFDSIAEGVGASQVKSLVTLLQKKQMSVVLISFEKSPPIDSLLHELKVAGVNWFPMKFGRNGLTGSLLRILKLYLKIICLSKVSVIHARSELATYTALLTPRKTPVIWDMRSLWSDQKLIIDGKQPRVVRYFLRKIESLCSRKASGLNTLTHASIPILESRNAILPTHKTVIPTSVDTERFKNSSVALMEVNCLLSGTLNDFYNLELLDQFITIAKLDFQIDTTWARPAETRQIYRFRNLGTTSQVTFEDMPRFMSRFNFGLILCKATGEDSLKASSPTKAAEFLSMGLPVVVSSGIGDLSRIVAERNIGVILDREDQIVTVLKDLLSLLKDPKLSERCRNTAIEIYSLDNAVEKYIDLYSSVVGKH